MRRISERYVLHESDLPKHWYNLAGHLSEPPPPPLDPGSFEPLGPESLEPMFASELIKQETSNEPFIEIPEQVLELYRTYRPSPLYRAHMLERALDTPAHLYYKFEGGSPSGSHKLNAAIPNVFYGLEDGCTRMTTATGAGQWGSAAAYACRILGLDCTVYMARVSYDQKPYRRILMETWGAEVIPSPSGETHTGQEALNGDPDSPGSLGIAVSESIEDAVSHENTVLGLGSFFNCVLMHQSIIGEEARLQMEMAGEYPDVVIDCVGAGSNFSGLSFPFLRDRLSGETETEFLAAETSASPTLTRGVYTYDLPTSAGATPLVKMYTLGNTFVPPPIHAGGLRSHAISPLVSYLYHQGQLRAVAYPQTAAFEAATQFARTQGILPAPESAHSVRAAIDEAIRARKADETRVILFNLSGHGHFDMEAYDEYLAGTMEDHVASDDQLRRAREAIPETRRHPTRLSPSNPA